MTWFRDRIGRGFLGGDIGPLGRASGEDSGVRAIAASICIGKLLQVMVVTRREVMARCPW